MCFHQSVLSETWYVCNVLGIWPERLFNVPTNQERKIRYIKDTQKIRSRYSCRDTIIGVIQNNDFQYLGRQQMHEEKQQDASPRRMSLPDHVRRLQAVEK